MTIEEIKYTNYVSTFIGISWKRHSWDREEGLDCRTMTVLFLRGLGYKIQEKDGLPIPDEEGLQEIFKDKDKKSQFVSRYLNLFIRQGREIDFSEIERNDIVVFETEEVPHISVYVGENRVLATTAKRGSILLKLGMIKKLIITIIRIPKGDKESEA